MKKNLHFIFWIATGAAIGSILREVVLCFFKTNTLWVVIVFINAFGSFVIAVVYEIEHRLHDNITLFTAIGFCGGFSSLSHFSYRTAEMIRGGDAFSALLNISISLGAVLLSAYLGILLVGLCRRLRRYA